MIQALYRKCVPGLILMGRHSPHSTEASAKLNTALRRNARPTQARKDGQQTKIPAEETARGSKRRYGLGLRDASSFAWPKCVFNATRGFH